MWKALVVLLLLVGCTKTTPTSAIVEEGVKHVDETIDYAENNIESNSDTEFLMAALKSCRGSLISCDVSCVAEKDTLESDISYWRLACLMLASIVGTLVYFLFKRK